MARDLLLITPPFTQLNTPYPATAYLKGFLNQLGTSSFQMDLGIETVLEIFSSERMAKVFDRAEVHADSLDENCLRIVALRVAYLRPLDMVIGFLQGRHQTFARRLCAEGFLPRAYRFEQLDDLDWAFGNMGIIDRAKHLCTLFLEDLSDLIVAVADPHFGFSRYAESLGQSASSFDELYHMLAQEPTFTDRVALGILEKRMAEVQPKLVCFSVPFPGNLYSAFRCAQWLKQRYPTTWICMGGGFPNTELRSLKDARVFEFFDFICLDDGERPIERLISQYVLTQAEDREECPKLKRTYMLRDGEVFFNNLSDHTDYKFANLGTPDYTDLRMGEYLSVIEVANPMHSLWSDGQWLKLTMAHGCYWGKCTFCDVSLDYIRLYEPVAAKTIVDRMENLMAQTGQSGFHFVDEAAPPALMREVAREILRRNLTVTWWTNIRFEKRFTADLCQLLKASGCIAVSGGLEVASDRLLALIDKGVTVAQVAQVTRNFTEAGIMVHAYLMYGYPTQTVQETVDSLEMVRQLFQEGVLQSGFWHRFALTAHSPIGLEPARFQVVPEKAEITFADNEVSFRDKTGVDHSRFSFGLKKSLYNFMHGVGYDLPLQDWFDFRIPRTTIAPDFIARCLAESDPKILSGGKLVWVGPMPIAYEIAPKKKGRGKPQLEFAVYTELETHYLVADKNKGEWVITLLSEVGAPEWKGFTWLKAKESFESAGLGDFEPFWMGKFMTMLRQSGLLLV